MARQAAPHSSASICMIIGTFATPFLTGCFTFFSGMCASPRQFHKKLIGVVDSSTSSASYSPSGGE